MQTTKVKQVDHTIPGNKWEFDANVTQVFDDMLSRSIPQYEVMRKAVFDIASDFVTPKSTILDLGCSRGEALAPFVEKFKQDNKFIGVEVSDAMIDAARLRFKDNEAVDICKMDLRTDYPLCNPSVTLSILTLQFTPIEHRSRILRTIYKHLLPGGVFILVEKILGPTAELDAMLVKHYYAMKAANGYSQEEIDRKRLSLEGVLVPVSAKWNEDLLHSVGFNQIDCFWRWFNFAGWVAVKSSEL